MSLPKLLITLGVALAKRRLARKVSNFRLEHLLGVAGLARRQTHFGQGLLIFGGGALVGAGAALLLAPASGKETRNRIGERNNKLESATSDSLRELQAELPALLDPARQGNGASKSASDGALSSR